MKKQSMTRTGNNFGIVSAKMLSVLSLIVVMIAMSSAAQAQEPIKETDVLVFAEEMPAFPGGNKALIEAIVKNIRYPDDAIEKKIEGKVLVRFIITKEGSAVQPFITKSLLPSLDAEVLKSIKKLPKFTPGKNGGVPVHVWYAVPVMFKIQ
jgi:protein TonB